jgi:hypothetical protein
MPQFRNWLYGNVGEGVCYNMNIRFLSYYQYIFFNCKTFLTFGIPYVQKYKNLFLYTSSVDTLYIYTPIYLYLSTYLFPYISISLHTYPSIYVSTYLYTNLSIYLSVCLCVSNLLPTHLPSCLHSYWFTSSRTYLKWCIVLEKLAFQYSDNRFPSSVKLTCTRLLLIF